jgi:putative FmdB family regulatory protein
MPTYEYVCMSCGHQIEVVQRFSDEPLRECPKCGGPLRRVFHPVGIVLKGSGFYSTDNRGGKRFSEAKKDAASETKSETTSETKTGETKKETKSESSSGKSSDSSSAQKKKSS